MEIVKSAPLAHFKVNGQVQVVPWDAVGWRNMRSWPCAPSDKSAIVIALGAGGSALAASWLRETAFDATLFAGPTRALHNSDSIGRHVLQEFLIVVNARLR